MSTTGLIQNTMIPMLRLGEMYLIAAESESETLNDGLPYINTLRNKRGISNLGSLTTTELTYEYMRELYGEGQLFYFYKRTFTNILNRTNNSGSKHCRSSGHPPKFSWCLYPTQKLIIDNNTRMMKTSNIFIWIMLIIGLSAWFRKKRL